MSLASALQDQKILVSELQLHLKKEVDRVKALEIEKQAQELEINSYRQQVECLYQQIRDCVTENKTSDSTIFTVQKQYESRIEKIKHDMNLIVEKFAQTSSKHNHEKKVGLQEIFTKNLNI